MTLSYSIFFATFIGHITVENKLLFQGCKVLQLSLHFYPYNSSFSHQEYNIFGCLIGFRAEFITKMILEVNLLIAMDAVSISLFILLGFYTAFGTVNHKLLLP